jgi:hypothetical protein
MNTVSINKRTGFVEVLHNGYLYHLGERPLITKSISPGPGIDLVAFGCWIHFTIEDRVLINGEHGPETIESLIDKLFNQVFN